MLAMKEDALARVERFKDMLLAKATGQPADEQEYRLLRKELLADASIKSSLPPFVHSCRSLMEFWGFIKPKFGHYHERRAFLQSEFDPLLSELEAGSATPSDEGTTAVVVEIDSAYVRDTWRKALDRRSADPEGAITSAKCLLESVCKHILDEENVPYDEHADLPKLYGLASRQLNLSPSQHSEPVFKQILGGCHAVVEGLGALRNRLSDSHGQGKKAVRALPRHAELAVNLSGAAATFILHTWQARKVTVKGG